MISQRVAYCISWAVLLLAATTSFTDLFGLTGAAFRHWMNSNMVILGIVLAMHCTQEVPE